MAPANYRISLARGCREAKRRERGLLRIGGEGKMAHLGHVISTLHRMLGNHKVTIPLNIHIWTTIQNNYYILAMYMLAYMYKSYYMYVAHTQR